jgi:hypothetical protein
VVDFFTGVLGRFSTFMLEPKGGAKKWRWAQTFRVPLPASALATVIWLRIHPKDYGARAFFGYFL